MWYVSFSIHPFRMFFIGLTSISVQHLFTSMREHPEVISLSIMNGDQTCLVGQHFAFQSMDTVHSRFITALTWTGSSYLQRMKKCLTPSISREMTFQPVETDCINDYLFTSYVQFVIHSDQLMTQNLSPPRMDYYRL